MSNMANLSSMDEVGLSSYPKQLKEGEESYLVKNYELLFGKYPLSATDLVLVVDSNNRVEINTLKGLGFNTSNVESIRFEDIIGTTFRIISNDDYYVKTEVGSYLPGQDYTAMYVSPKSITVEIVGVIRQKQDVRIGILGSGIAYSDELAQRIIDDAVNSDCKAR